MMSHLVRENNTSGELPRAFVLTAEASPLTSHLSPLTSHIGQSELNSEEENSEEL